MPEISTRSPGSGRCPPTLSTKTPPVGSWTKNLPFKAASAAVTIPVTDTFKLAEARSAESEMTSAALVKTSRPCCEKARDESVKNSTATRNFKSGLCFASGISSGDCSRYEHHNLKASLTPPPSQRIPQTGIRLSWLLMKARLLELIMGQPVPSYYW